MVNIDEELTQKIGKHGLIKLKKKDNGNTKFVLASLSVRHRVKGKNSI